MENMVRKTLHQLGIYNLRETFEDTSLKIQGKPYYWTTYPMAVQLDTTNKCGPKHSGIICEYCFPQNEVLCGRDTHAEMPMEWIRWIFKDIAKNMPHITNGEWPPVQQTCLFLNGDWQNELRGELILSEYHSLLSWLPSQVFTCGTKPEEAWRFCNEKLDWVCVTLSASNSENYKKVYRADKFNDVLKTMKYIDSHAWGNQKLETHFVITENNIGGMAEWYKLIGEKFPRWRRVFSPLVRSETNLPSVKAMGNLTLEQQEKAICDVVGYQGFWDHTKTGFRQPCVLWNNAAITVHGDILQCCNWSEASKWNYGNIKDYIAEGRSLKDYWLERLANKQRNSLCRACNLKRPDAKRLLDNIKVEVKV
jgi:radical SAM protein with 4Fe4S-binding SPASM domain